MIERIVTGFPRLVAFKLQGILHDDDYRTFVPAIEAELANHGKLRLLAYLEDFEGWDLRAAWDDFSFGLKHYDDFDRFAVVGDRAWEKWMAKLGKAFTAAEVRYFSHADMDQAWAWLREGL